VNNWISYATWEANQSYFDRSRSVFEGALDVDSINPTLSLNYAETEMKSRNLQHARNILDRAVCVLPRMNQLWYKYVYLEELAQDVSSARQTFERWMNWQPDGKAWQAYIKMEMRYRELDRASAIYQRWMAIAPDPQAWLEWARFEEDRERLEQARSVYQLASAHYRDSKDRTEEIVPLYCAWAKMEAKMGHVEEARRVLKVCIGRCQHIPPDMLTKFPISLQSPCTLKIYRAIFFKLTQNSRNGTVHLPMSNWQLLAAVGPTLRINLRGMRMIMTLGSNTPSWKCRVRICQLQNPPRGTQPSSEYDMYLNAL
jgi:tetratricopeptide (TPR) repeat protein